MAHLTRPAEISGVSAGSFPETAAGNRAYSVCFRLPITKKKAVKFSNSIFSLLFVSFFDF